MAQNGSRESAVVIAGQTFRVCFSVLGIVGLRDHWKMESDDEVLSRLDEIARNFGKGKQDFRAIADLLWGGLQEYHPEVTPDQALRLLSQAGLPEIPNIVQKVFAGLIAGSPPQEARQARPPKAKDEALASTS